MASVAVLERGLKILDLLIEVESDPVRRVDGVSVQQVAAQLEIHKSTASRLMQTLVASGYAVPRPGGRRGFRLGPAIQVHTTLSEDQRRLSELAHPFLVRLVEQTGECAHAVVASGGWALVIDDVETAQALRVVAGRGRRVPLHCTSAGKCLLAFGLAQMPTQTPARTARTITNPQILRLHLAEIVTAGHAVDDEENHLGVRCISAPVFDGPDGDAIGCIGIDGPTLRMGDDQIDSMAASVRTVARELTLELGATRAVEAVG
jgi:DNA-binding IclR family transcriptional regulator